MAKNKRAQKPLKLKDIPKGDISYFVSYFKPHLKLFLADLMFAVIVAVIDVAFPVISRTTLNTLLPRFSENPSQVAKIFVLVIAGCLVLYGLRTLAYWFITYFGHVFGVAVEKDMRADIFRHIQKQSYSFFDKNRTGMIMSRATTDLFDISELAHHGPEDLLISFLTLLGAFGVMLSIRWELAVIVFISLPIMIFVTYNGRKRVMNSSAGVKMRTAEINTELESSISGIRVTKVFTNEKYEMEKFSSSNQAFFDAKKENYKAMAGMHSKMEFTTHILNVVVLAVGGWFIMHDRMTVGDLVAANLFVSAFLQPIRRLTNFVEQFSNGMAGFMRFSEVMRTHEEIYEKSDAVEITDCKGEISFENVNFEYNEGMEVLKDFNLKVPAGKTVALVGPSGGGKTTVCHLLPRFYDYTEGKITLDGTDIKDLTIESLRRQIGFVQQDVFLFAGTVRENIAYGKPGATDEEIETAAKRAEIYDDIMKMPNGFDTVVGERGIKLSGGQKQRVSIARVFLKNPPILVLDEATSALDTVTEIKIQDAFDELSKGRTTFVIAHRLSTIRNADIIAVVENNKIVETGTHEELLARKGEYYKLHTAQSIS
ncbi:MAG: ABC transporter ATP-binding protein [Treponema sp.]|nr:ABC transporter ATP-binding protein [Candidatus Treponema equifaecale]